MSQDAKNFARETWSLYGVAMLVVALRYTARIRRFGIRGLKIDDYAMVNCVIWYTLLCVAFNQIKFGDGSNLMNDDEIAALTPEIKASRIAGSKWVLVSEHSMLLAIWSTKVCVLVLYASITEGLEQRKWVNYVAIYTALSFIGSELALFLACRPIQQYWAVPAANPQCSNFQYFEIVQGSLSIPGDMAILAIGIPILVQLHLPIQQKAILLIIFGMGGFIIVAAILTKVYCLVPELISYVYMNWYFREASVAVYVTNLPAVWPLVREVFPHLNLSGSHAKVTNVSGNRPWVRSNSRARITSNDFDMKEFKRAPGAESQERINDSDSGKSLEPQAIEIQRDVTFTVQSESIARVAANGAPDVAPDGRWDLNHMTTVVSTAR
ncbi:Uncharacterized protein BP5553_00234 [Venustampulla echinocandica]|uniref:Rhodopsin domain-containing protein n=1 Tax=Venustampulla echinocandica TaxID=2656787 RepID=A0A370TXI7_9HELO|nr:Uncharacterized protein BP5553_00234 [Venustampulla echinocandica]RDL40255.1 Uncharacterized protein BP5553_00234 [Venustampulla echinocandica]